MITLAIEDRVARVTLDRPEQRNALTPAMLVGLREGALQGMDSGARVVLIEGRGRAFSAGFDLRLAGQDASGETLRQMLRELSRTIVALRTLDVPVVIACQGAAIAGACALLGGADVVVADEEAKIGYPVLLLGISPGVSAPFLAHDLTPGIARERMLDTRLISGRSAFEIGLVHVLVQNPEGVRVEASRVAAAISEQSPWATTATKRWLNRQPKGIVGSLDEAEIAGALGVSLGMVGTHEERELMGNVWGRNAS